MAFNCIQCGSYASEDLLCITPFGLAPVCGDRCLQRLNNMDSPLDKLQQIYLDNFKRIMTEETQDELTEKNS